MQAQWTLYKSVMICHFGTVATKSSKVAAFDFDGCLVGKMWHDTACPMMFSEIPAIFAALHQAGFKICILSNQGEIGRASQDRDQVISKIKSRFDSFLKQVGIPCLVIASTTSDEYRKPQTGMFELVIENSPVTEGFYVGDAAGRPGDFSDSDLRFAQNLNLPFFNETEFFRDKAYRKFISSEIHETAHVPKGAVSFSPSDRQEMLLMVGYPGSGKSTFTSSLDTQFYTTVHGDDYKSDKKRIAKAVKSVLETGKSVVVDVTNRNIESRAYYSVIAQELNIPVRVVWMSTPYETCVTRNNSREDLKKVPMIAMYRFRKDFEEPTSSEGFDEIIRI